MGDVNHKKKNYFIPKFYYFQTYIYIFTPWDINNYVLLTTVCLKAHFNQLAFYGF